MMRSPIAVYRSGGPELGPEEAIAASTPSEARAFIFFAIELLATVGVTVWLQRQGSRRR
jgi:hypothetical protein